MTKKKNKDEDLNPARMWHHLALLQGYNELAKKADKIGEKVYCRLAVQEAERNLAKLGVTVQRDNGDLGPIVLTLPYRAPHVEFYEKDIELMRADVAAYDERKEKP